MDPLTDRQARVLAFIRDRIAADGRPPTVREIARRFRIASTNGVRRHLTALEKKGYIERHARSARGITLAAELQEHDGLPIIGQVAAGTPIAAIENLEGHLAIDSLFPDRASLFCLRVQGDSMVDAGILDGDYVICRQRAAFEHGEVGVAVIDGEATVKTLRRRGQGIDLVPANDAYDTLHIDPSEQEFRYAGKVVGVHRAL